MRIVFSDGHYLQANKDFPDDNLKRAYPIKLPPKSCWDSFISNALLPAELRFRNWNSKGDETDITVLMSNLKISSKQAWAYYRDYLAEIRSRFGKIAGGTQVGQYGLDAVVAVAQVVKEALKAREQQKFKFAGQKVDTVYMFGSFPNGRAKPLSSDIDFLVADEQGRPLDPKLKAEKHERAYVDAVNHCRGYRDHELTDPPRWESCLKMLASALLYMAETAKSFREVWYSELRPFNSNVQNALKSMGIENKLVINVDNLTFDNDPSLMGQIMPAVIRINSEKISLLFPKKRKEMYGYTETDNYVAFDLPDTEDF